MKIFIPTYRRVENQLTWNTIHPDLRKHITFVVRADEATVVSTRYSPSKVEILPANRQNGYIGAMQHIFDINDGAFIYMDDDITALYRALRFFNGLTTAQKLAMQEARWARERLTTAEGQLALFQAITEEVLAPWVATCSPRPPHVAPMERLTRANGIRPGQHTVQFVAFDSRKIKAAGVRWDEPPHTSISDALFNLRLLHAGLDCRYDCKYSFNAVPMFGGAGGINSDEGTGRKQQVLDDHHLLHSLFPGAMVPKKQGTRTPKTSYLNIPYVFHRQRYLLKRREELGIATDEDDTRMATDYFAFNQ